MSLSINASSIPLALRERPQWVLWRIENRGGTPTKIPYSTDGPPARSNDPATWAPFDVVLDVFERGVSGGTQYSGIGYMFSATDEFCGIDLDGCRDPETSEWSDWARAIIADLDSYAELSPSGSGAKIFIRGKCPHASGKNTRLPGVASLGGKQAGIEVYDKLRYFAVTGQRLRGVQPEPMERQDVLERLCSRWFGGGTAPRAASGQSPPDVLARSARYIARMPVSISGSGGHNAAFHVACTLVLGFGLSQDEAFRVMAEWNQACQPPWTEKELRHKLADADKQPGERNYLRDTPRDGDGNASDATASAATASSDWIPQEPAEAQSSSSQSRQPIVIPRPKTVVRVTRQELQPSQTLVQAARDYLAAIKSGKLNLLSLGLPAVDYAIGGGVERSEVIIIGARPSHGKTSVGLQAAYTAAAAGRPVLIISEEMSRLALGKRAIQYACDLPEDVWRRRESDVLAQLEAHFATQAPIHIVESCGTVERAADAIRGHVEANGVQCVVVDYGQLLGSRGGNRYEQMSRTSITLRQLANELKISLIVLAQLNRDIETRDKFIPRLSDLRDAGQWEQDADVILFLLWPYRLDPKRDQHEYFIFIAKNRNRPIHEFSVKCQFDPTRQRLLLNAVWPTEAEVDEWSERYRDF